MNELDKQIKEAANEFLFWERLVCEKSKRADVNIMRRCALRHYVALIARRAVGQ